ncbi:MAG: PEGA domain-containing protein [bacterium]
MRAYILCLFVSAALLVNAQPGEARAAGNKAQARKFFNQGELHYQQGEFRKALSYYKRAQKAYQHPAFIFNIAQCHRQLNEYRKALFFYELFLSESPKASNLAEVQRRIKEMKKRVAELVRAERRKGKLSVITVPAGAEIFVDRVKGAASATSPAILAVEAGQHLVMVRLRGYYTVHRTVDVKERRVALLQITLRSRGGITPPPDRRVVTPPPDRRVVTPPPDRRVVTPPPDRRVVTPPPDRRRVDPGGETSLPAGKSKPFYKRWWFWAGVGLAVVAVGVAAYTGSTALGMQREWDDKLGVVDDPDGFQSKAKTLGAVTDAMIGVGAAAAIAVTVGAILVELRRKKDRQSATRVLPGCGPAGCGLFVTGRF